MGKTIVSPKNLLNRKTKLRLTGDLSLKWNEEGQLFAQASMNRNSIRLSADVIPLLDQFKLFTEQGKAIERYLSRYSDRKDDALKKKLEETLSKLVRCGILIPENHRDRTLAPRWFGDVATHVRMLWDYTRTSAYREAISRNVRGKTVLEIGCGTGILACFAAIAGAKHVYAIEESAIISVAREITKANGLQEVITLIPGNSTDAELPEKVDLIYSEIIGINPLEERLIPTLSDGVSRFLKPGGTTMPSHFSLWVAGIESDLLEERYLRAEEHTAVVERFSEVYGLDLSSIADHYRESVIQSLEKEKFHRNVGGMEPTSPLRSGERILTDEACIRMFDLLRLPREAPFRKELVLQARRSGTHSGTAMFFKARLDELTTISTSPFAPVQPKSWAGQVIQAMPPLAVSRGARIHLEACFDPSVSRDIFFHRVTGPT